MVNIIVFTNLPSIITNSGIVIVIVIDLITALGKDRITAVLHVSRVKNITRNLKG